MPANGLRVNHDFVALHSMWIIFVKGYCVLVRMEIIHKSISTYTYTYIIQLIPHWGFSMAEYIKCYAYF